MIIKFFFNVDYIIINSKNSPYSKYFTLILLKSGPQTLSGTSILNQTNLEMFSRGLQTLKLRIWYSYSKVLISDMRCLRARFLSSYFEIETIIRFCLKDPKIWIFCKKAVFSRFCQILSQFNPKVPFWKIQIIVLIKTNILR